MNEHVCLQSIVSVRNQEVQKLAHPPCLMVLQSWSVYPREPQTTSSTLEVITISTSGALLAISILLVFALLVSKTAGILVVAGSDSRVSHSH